MDIKFVNPYGAIGPDFTNCMNSIGSNISKYTTPVIDNLVDFTYSALVSQYSI